MKKEKVFLLGYKDRFVCPIRAGIKTVTIRQIRKDGRLPEIGQILRKYTGLRTPRCMSIFDFKNGEIEPRCTGVWPIEIGIIKTHWGNFPKVKTKFFTEIMGCNGDELVYSGAISHENILEKFAIMDGWENFDQMIEFFRPRLPLKANIIYWGER